MTLLFSPVCLLSHLELAQSLEHQTGNIRVKGSSHPIKQQTSRLMINMI